MLRMRSSVRELDAVLDALPQRAKIDDQSILRSSHACLR